MFCTSGNIGIRENGELKVKNVSSVGPNVEMRKELYSTWDVYVNLGHKMKVAWMRMS